MDNRKRNIAALKALITLGIAAVLGCGCALACILPTIVALGGGK